MSKRFIPFSTARNVPPSEFEHRFSARDHFGRRVTLKFKELLVGDRVPGSSPWVS
jgi:hypothetical protein